MRILKWMIAATALSILASCAAPQSESKPEPQVTRTFYGAASWYGPHFHGRPTANGERFDSAQLTAAHKTLPFNTKVRVTNEENGKSVIVRINDRGPYAGKRVIDLSQGAAERIGLLSRGVGTVKLDILAGT